MVKGGPDVVLARCSSALLPTAALCPSPSAHAVDAANDDLGRRGLRVLAMAVRPMPDGRTAPRRSDGRDPDLVFLGLVGIVDPLRPEAIEAVRTAHGAGIEVRMITGDHLVTAEAIGDQLGLGGGGMMGSAFAAPPTASWRSGCRTSTCSAGSHPQDKLRLVRLMQGRGDIVAMTGDAVNDAAALKQADIGVAMGSGSEVSKQAAKMVLTDDNFATLVTPSNWGAASTQDHVLHRIPDDPAVRAGHHVLARDHPQHQQRRGPAAAAGAVPQLHAGHHAGHHHHHRSARPGRDGGPAPRPGARIFNSDTAFRWIALGLVFGGASLLTVAYGPDEPSGEVASVSVTMAYAVMGLATGLAGLVMRKTTASAFARPVVPAALLVAAGVAITIASTEVGFLQGFLKTTELSGGQWATCMGLALLFALTVEAEKAVRRRRIGQA